MVIANDQSIFVGLKFDNNFTVKHNSSGEYSEMNELMFNGSLG